MDAHDFPPSFSSPKLIGARRGRLSSVFALALLGVGTAPLAASAQNVVLTPRGDAALALRHEAEVLETARSVFSGRGESIVTAEQVATAFQVALETPCELGCVRELLRASGSSRAVEVGLWGSGEAVTSVGVALFDADGNAAHGEASVGRGGLSAALAEAMEQALEAWPARAGVLVAMVGSPPGATVTVDGQPFGTLPAQGRLPAGEHSLTASAPGFAQLRQRFSVPATGEQLSLRLELEPLGAERPGSRRGRGWIAGPVLLGLGAGALAAPVLVAMARRGCASEREGVCAIEDRTNDTRLIAIGATSGALALGTIVWSVAGARRGRARDVTVEVGVGRLRVAF